MGTQRRHENMQLTALPVRLSKALVSNVSYRCLTILPVMALSSRTTTLLNFLLPAFSGTAYGERHMTGILKNAIRNPCKEMQNVGVKPIKE